MELSKTDQRNLDLSNWRVDVIRSLRQLADILASTPHERFPTPNIFISMYSAPKPTVENPYNEPNLTQDDVRRFMAASPGDWSKLNLANQISYTKTINDAVRLHYYVGREQVCTRVQTGVKWVEATEAHEEPVYEWQCDTPEIEV